MGCDVVRKDISAYVDGELIENKKIIVESHLQKCPDCKRVFNQFTAQSQVLREVVEIEPSPDFDSRFWTKLAGKTERVHLRTGLLDLIFSPARLVFASILLGVLVGGILGKFTSFGYFSSIPTQKMYFERLNLYAFNNFPRGSIGGAYLTLSTKR